MSASLSFGVLGADNSIAHFSCQASPFSIFRSLGFSDPILPHSKVVTIGNR